MLAGTRQRLSLTRKLDIHIGNTHIKNVSEQKLLGVYIDENLSWSTHIDYLCSVIASKISLLRQISEYVPVDVQFFFIKGISYLI